MLDLKLTDMQLRLLSAASQREDHLVTLPETLRGGAVKIVTSKLLKVGLVEEVPVGLTQPDLHRADDGQATGLKLTEAGLAAIGLEPEGTAPETPPEPPQSGTDTSYAASMSARESSKRTKVIELLSREEGTSLDELIAATGWQPHTTRAALTGLRQRGYAITRSQEERGSVYRITDLPPAGSAPMNEPKVALA